MDKPIVEQVYYLQRYKEGWGGKWEEKIDLRECIDQRTGFEKVNNKNKMGMVYPKYLVNHTYVKYSLTHI